MSQSFSWPIAIIFSVILWIILIPIFGPIFLLLWIYKYLIVYPLMKIVRYDLQMINGSDAGVIDNLKKNTLYNIGVLFILETPKSGNNGIRVEEAGQHFADLFLGNSKGSQDKYWKLRKIYKSFGGFYFWEDAKDFNIQNHISEHTIKCEDDLDEFVGDWIKSPYEKSSPLWGMALITWNNGRSGQVRSAVTFRIHHAYADGISVLQLAHKLAGTTPSSIPSHSPRTIGFARKATLYFVLPYVLKRMMGKIFSAPNPFKNIPAKDDSYLLLQSIPLEVVKKIKRQLNVPFATVLMTVVGGIVRRLLKESNQDMPEYVCLGSALLWPFRQSDSLCNEWTIGSFKIPIAEQNPVERLKVTAADFQSYMKEGGHIVLKPFIFGLTSLIPFGLFHRFVNPNKDTVPMGPAAIMSGSLVGNLDQTYSLWGSQVTNVYPIACNADPHLALGCISSSHGTKMDVAMVVDQSLFPQNSNLKEKLPKYFVQELDWLSTKADDYSVCNGDYTEKRQG